MYFCHITAFICEQISQLRLSINKMCLEILHLELQAFTYGLKSWIKLESNCHLYTSQTFYDAYTKIAALVHNSPYSYIETRDCTCKQAVMATLPGVNESQRFSYMRHTGISCYNQPGPASIPYWLINRYLELQIHLYFPHILDYNFQN